MFRVAKIFYQIMLNKRIERRLYKLCKGSLAIAGGISRQRQSRPQFMTSVSEFLEPPRLRICQHDDNDKSWYKELQSRATRNVHALLHAG